MGEAKDYCIMSSGYLIRYPQLKPRILFSNPADIGRLRSDLEASTEEAFRRIDRAKRQSLAASHDIRLD